jgi:glycosyltransferase involved in cell wall biosynthesis
MRIAYICTDVDIPVFGHEGCSIHIREVTNAFVELGHDVSLYASWLGGAKPPDMRAPVVPIEPSGPDAAAWTAIEQEPIVANNYLDRDLKSVLANEWLQKLAGPLFERERPDFIYERYSLFGWGGLVLSRRYGVPLIIEVNTPLRQEQDGYERFTLVRTAERMDREILQGADACIVVSSVVGDWVQSCGVPAERVLVIPNGVSAARFERPTDGAGMRARFGVTGGRVIGFVGSFQPWHDVGGLIRAFARVRGRNPDARLLLVGYGPQRDDLVALAGRLGLSGVVAFAGSLPHDDIPACLAAMDVVVAPYARWNEPFYGSPMKVFEYMAAGRPIVAAGLGQITGIIEHRRTGWLYAAGDEDALVAGLEAMLADSAAAAAMGAAAREKALREHTWKAVAVRVVSRAAELIASRKG